MTDSKIHYAIKNLFETLNDCADIDSLNAIIQRHELQQDIESFYAKYPVLNITLKPEEIQALKDAGVIDANHRIDLRNFPRENALAKLLIAMIWKSGDINKIQYIIDGITNEHTSSSDYALLYRQFGRSLSRENEPVVDQHVLRAFGIYLQAEPAAVAAIRRKSIYKLKDEGLLQEYCSWFQRQVEQVPAEQRQEYIKKLDKILFIFGKRASL